MTYVIRVIRYRLGKVIQCEYVDFSHIARFCMIYTIEVVLLFQNKLMKIGVY